MRKGGTLFTITYYGSQMVVKNYNIMGVAKAALEARCAIWRPSSAPRASACTPSPGPLATRAASGIPEFDELLDKARAKAPTLSLVSIDDVASPPRFWRTTRHASSPARPFISTAVTTLLTCSGQSGAAGQEACAAPAPQSRLEGKGDVMALKRTVGSNAKTKMKRKAYERELQKLQVELCHLQDWVKKNGSPYYHRVRRPRRGRQGRNDQGHHRTREPASVSRGGASGSLGSRENADVWAALH